MEIVPDSVSIYESSIEGCHEGYPGAHLPLMMIGLD